ncbi:MAG: Wzz/FepE/Etk N-terminal domain-containing protein, partial [Pseudomonadota bacterium]
MSNQTDNPIDLSRYVGVIRRRRTLILSFCLSATLTSLALTYVFSEKYRAHTTLLYRPYQSVQFQLKQQGALGFPPPFVLIESIGHTIEGVAKSDVVVQQVVRLLRLDQDDVRKPEPNWFKALLRDIKKELKAFAKTVWQILKYGRIIEEDRFVEAVRGLQKNIAVKPSKKAYTFILEVIDSDPSRAAAIIDTEAELLAEFLRQENVRVARQGRIEIEGQLQQNEQELSMTRKALEQFKQTEQIFSLTEETSLQLKTIAQLEEEAIRVGKDLRAMERKLKELLAQLGKQKPFVKYMS